MNSKTILTKVSATTIVNGRFVSVNCYWLGSCIHWQYMKNKRLLVIIGALVLVSLLFLILFRQKAAAPKPATPPQTDTVASQQTPEPQKPTFDKKMYSIDDPSSKWVVVNKKRPLPDGYVPADLIAGLMRNEAYNQLQVLQAGAKNTGYNLSILSAYRSQATQASTYGAYVAKDGVAQADTYSARPRHSEHQTGLAVDVGNGVCNLEICFGNTAAGQWLAAHAHEYGYIIRYQQGKTPITGYQYEPWHLRYVGEELAAEIYKSKLTLEEFFDLPAAPIY